MKKTTTYILSMDDVQEAVAEWLYQYHGACMEKEEVSIIYDANGFVAATAETVEENNSD